MVFYNICLPLSKYRRLAVTVVVLISIAMLVASGIISYTSNTVDPVFGISFMEMNGPAYLITALIVVVLASLYFILYKIFRKDDKDEN